MAVQATPTTEAPAEVKEAPASKPSKLWKLVALAFMVAIIGGEILVAMIYLSGDGEYQFSEAINQGEATNQLRVSCMGEELSLAVNGVPLATVVDGALESGDVGLAASTFQPGATTIQFDDFRVLAP